jgi:tRNA-dihydrouridine synthase
MEWKGERLGIVEMRRHYTNYFKGMANFKDFRTRLVTEDHSEELLRTLAEISEAYSHYEFA